MTNSSATGGPLLPTSPPPADDDALQALLQGLVADMTGLAGAMVRPRWPGSAGTDPDISTNWCAIGLTDSAPDAGPVILHQSAGDGAEAMQRHETLTVTASFYGTAASANAALLRDGLMLPQNRETIRTAGLAFVESGHAVLAPDLVNQQWRRKVDVPITFRRQVTRAYPVLNLLSAAGETSADPGPAIAWTTE